MTDEPSTGDPHGRPFDNAVTETRAESIRRRVPKQIGQFHIKDVIASGGMGGGLKNES